MNLDEKYNVDTLENYRIKSRWRFVGDVNQEYYYAQRKIWFGWCYFDKEMYKTGLTGSTFWAVFTGMLLICSGVGALSGWMAGDYYIIPWCLGGIPLSVISMFGWLKTPYGGFTDINLTKDVINKRLEFLNRKQGSENLDISIKIQRKKKLDKLNTI